MKTEFRYLDSYTFKHNSKKNTGSKSTSPRPANGYGTVRRYIPIKKNGDDMQEEKTIYFSSDSAM